MFSSDERADGDESKSMKGPFLRGEEGRGGLCEDMFTNAIECCNKQSIKTPLSQDRDQKRDEEDRLDCFASEKCQVVCREMFSKCFAEILFEAAASVAGVARKRTRRAVVCRQIPTGFTCVKRQHRCWEQLPLGRDRKELFSYSTTSKNIRSPSFDVYLADRMHVICAVQLQDITLWGW